MIRLVPLGKVEGTVLSYLKDRLSARFHQETEIGLGVELPKPAWNSQRHQYLASSVLESLPRPSARGRVLGVAEADLYAPRLNFVFGQAEVSGGRAVISLHRLRQDFYGLPPDPDLLLERALKEAVHELGHTYGLAHCPDPHCVMHFSNSLADTDRKSADFCPVCSRKLDTSPN